MISPTTTPVNGGAARARSSTSRPAIVSLSHSVAVSIGGSTSVRSQCSENFIASPHANCAQEAQVVLEEQPQVVDAVAQHREPVEAHAEREAV